MRFSRLFFFLLISVNTLSAPALAQEIFEYTPPKPLEATQPRYPQSAARTGTEGYVIYGFMIGTDGKPYDPYISESTSSMFERSSLKALEQLEYEPAKLDGEPVDTAHYYKFTFAMSKGVGVAPSFNRDYKQFHKALEKGDLENASKYHETLSDKATDNLYEMGWANLAGFHLAKARGLPHEQYAYLKKAMAYHHGDYSNLSFISEDQEPSARFELFRLQTELNYFAEALSTFHMMEKQNDEHIEALRPIYQQILNVADNDSRYSIDAQLDNDGGWTIGLHKSAFYVNEVEGRLSEIKLHCSAKYAVFAYTEGSQYEIPAS